MMLLGIAPALAQPVGGVATNAPGVEVTPAPQPLGDGSMPGGLTAPSALTLSAGTFSVGVLGGYGFRNTLLSADHEMTRGIGDLAFGFAITDLLSVALSFDGRYDKHTGVAPAGDDGYVGDPHLLVRAGRRFGKITAGGQLDVWVPGKDAPSVAVSATSVGARGLLSLAAGPGIASFSAGFRFDNSEKSVADPAKLSVEDRVSLGVSEFHALLASAHYTLPVAAKTFVGMEASGDIFVGSGAPGSILRIGATGGIHLTPQWQLFAFVRGAKVPGIDYSDAMAGNIVLVPYEPVFTGGLGLAGTFGRSKGRGSILTTPQRTIEVEIIADLEGKVVDDSGKPVAGAKVTVKLKTTARTAASDEKGEWRLDKLPIGKLGDEAAAEITCELGGKKPKSITLVLQKGTNPIEACTLDPLLPPTTFKAVVRAGGSGKALVGATIKLEPGGLTGKTDADGLVSIDNVPAGTYQVTASMPGYKDQTLETVLESNLVGVKNFELRK